MTAYVRAYVRWKRSGGDLYYGWRAWDCSLIVQERWGW